MKLPVKQITQEWNECGPAALAQVLNYYGKKYDLKEIIKEVSLNSDKWRDWLFNIGSYAIKEGFSVSIILLSTDIFDPAWFNLSKRELIKKLDLEKEYYSKNPNEMLPWFTKEIDSSINYLEKGGLILFKPITSSLIREYINKKIPLIVSLNYSLLRTKSRASKNEKNEFGSTVGHVVVISGYTEKEFVIVDPAGETYNIPAELLIESILRRDQGIVAIENNKA